MTATAHIESTLKISNAGKVAQVSIQFEEHGKVYHLNMKVLELVIEQLDRLKGATGVGIDALRKAADLEDEGRRNSRS